MRTVAFSNAGIVKLLNEQFVCAWVNKRPDLKFKDGLYPKEWRPRGLSVGAAAANVTAVFAASDGRVIHAMPGYLDESSFKKQIEFAQALHEQLYDPSVKKKDRAGLYAKVHAQAAKESRNRVESRAHQQLAKRFMQVDEMSLEYFDGQGCAIV